MKITFVKQRFKDGGFCSKCDDVQAKLEQSDLLQYIDETLVIEEEDPSSEGLQWVRDYKIPTVPFFVVENDAKEPQIYTVYFKFVKEVLDPIIGTDSTLKSLLEGDTDADFE